MIVATGNLGVDLTVDVVNAQGKCSPRFDLFCGGLNCGGGGVNAEGTALPLAPAALDCSCTS